MRTQAFNDVFRFTLHINNLLCPVVLQVSKPLLFSFTTDYIDENLIAWGFAISLGTVRVPKFSNLLISSLNGFR